MMYGTVSCQLVLFWSRSRLASGTRWRIYQQFLFFPWSLWIIWLKSTSEINFRGQLNIQYLLEFLQSSWITMWKLQNFSVPQILREIKIDEFKVLKLVALTYFDFYDFLLFMKPEIYQINQIQSPWIGKKWQFCNFEKLNFMQFLNDRKNWNFHTAWISNGSSAQCGILGNFLPLFDLTWIQFWLILEGQKLSL